MAEIQIVPNSISSFGGAARFIFRRKCGEDPSPEAAVEYAGQLEAANAGRPSPAAADIRWWPWVHHNVLNDDIIFRGPDPVCPKPALANTPEKAVPAEPVFEPLDITAPREPSPAGKVIKGQAILAVEQARKRLQADIERANSMVTFLMGKGAMSFANNLVKEINKAQQVLDDAASTKQQLQSAAAILGAARVNACLQANEASLAGGGAGIKCPLSEEK